MITSSNFGRYLFYSFILLIVQFDTTNNLFSQVLPQHVIESYEEDGWVYTGNAIFIYKDRYNETGDPEVLSLQIDQVNNFALLILNKYDCINHRMMTMAYKRFENKLFIEKEHYIFDNKREWIYPLKTTLGDLWITTICKKYGN